MDKTAIEARRAYQKAWREKNRDKQRIYTARYWKKKAEQLQAVQSTAESEAKSDE